MKFAFAIAALSITDATAVRPGDPALLRSAKSAVVLSNDQAAAVAVAPGPDPRDTAVPLALADDLPTGARADTRGGLSAAGEAAFVANAPVPGDDGATDRLALRGGAAADAKAVQTPEFVETELGANLCGRDEILSSAECVKYGDSKGYHVNPRVDVGHIPYGCVCKPSEEVCWYNLRFHNFNNKEAPTENDVLVVCKKLELLDPSLPVPAGGGDCNEKNYYVEMRLENAEYRNRHGGKYDHYTDDESRAQSDCQAMEDCLGYLKREHPVYKGEVHRGWTLLFEGGRGWQTNVGTTKVAKMKVPGVEVCVPKDPTPERDNAMALGSSWPGNENGDIIETGPNAKTCGSNSDLDSDQCALVAANKCFGFVRGRWNTLPHGCVCNDVGSNCYYNTNTDDSSATGNLVCKTLELMDPATPVPAGATCTHQNFYVERPVVGEYRNRHGGKYDHYTDDETVAQADCQRLDDCHGYCLREHHTHDGKIAGDWFLVFDGPRYVPWTSDSGTTKIGKKKVGGVSVCVPSDPA